MAAENGAYVCLYMCACDGTKIRMVSKTKGREDNKEKTTGYGRLRNRKRERKEQ